MEKFKIKIISPQEQYFQGEVISVSLPSLMGEIEVFAHHEPILSVLAAGYVKVKVSETEVKRFFITGGYLDCADKVSVVVDKIYQENQVTKEFFETQKAHAEAEVAKVGLSDNRYEFETDKIARYAQLLNS